MFVLYHFSFFMPLESMYLSAQCLDVNHNQLKKFSLQTVVSRVIYKNSRSGNNLIQEL